MTLRGDGFTAGPITASLGASPIANLQVDSATQLQGTTPAGAGFSDAVVQRGATTAVLPRAYYHGAWATVGPTGGNVRDLATAGANDIYAATDGGGVYRSTDQGVTWNSASAGLTNKRVERIAVDPTNPWRVFAATRDGVFVTTTGGVSWAKAGNTPTFTVAVAIAPGSPERIFTLSGGRIYRSTDGGATWLQVHSGLSNPTNIAVAPTDPSIVFVSTESGIGAGIVKSTDGGTTWSPSGTGLPNPQVSSVVVHPADASIVYAASTFRVYKSTNGGASWAATGYNFLFAPHRIAIDPAGKLYVGSYDPRVVTSADGGATWTEISTGINTNLTPDVNCIVVRPNAPAELLIGVGHWGIYRTTSAGASWAKSDAGLHAANIPFIAVSPTTAGTAFAVGVGRELWKTTDHGATWFHSWNVATILSDPRSVGFHPTQPDLVLAGASGVYRSTNGGQSWTAVNQGINGAGVLRILFDPELPSRVFAGAGSGLYRSLDTGLTWQLVYVPTGSSDVRALIRRGGALLAGGTYLHRSLDNGATWALYGTGLALFITDLQPDPHDPAGVYALADDILHRSTNGGATWTAVTPSSMVVTAFAIDPTRPATIYLATAQGPSVLRSLTGLTTIVPFDAGLPAGVGQTLAIDKTGGTVYLGTASAGLRRLGD